MMEFRNWVGKTNLNESFIFLVNSENVSIFSFWFLFSFSIIQDIVVEFHIVSLQLSIIVSSNWRDGQICNQLKYGIESGTDINTLISEQKKKGSHILKFNRNSISYIEEIFLVLLDNKTIRSKNLFAFFSSNLLSIIQMNDANGYPEIFLVMYELKFFSGA